MSMAEINVSKPHKGPTKRMKKLSTKVDLTPMVDLGFLLITFFIFTTSMSEPKAMKLKLPAEPKNNDSMVTAEGKTFNVIADDRGKVYFYMGDDISSIKETSFGPNGIRSQIIEKQKIVEKKYGDSKELIILLKPTSRSSYENVVELLDEMLINGVTRYVLTDPTEVELKQLSTSFK